MKVRNTISSRLSRSSSFLVVVAVIVVALVAFEMIDEAAATDVLQSNSVSMNMRMLLSSSLVEEAGDNKGKKDVAAALTEESERYLQPPPQPSSWSNEDMMRLFHITSSAEDYIFGAASSSDISIRNSNPDNNPTNFNGFLPQNVQRCTDANPLDPYTLTGVNSGDGELFPDLVLPGSFYKDLNYTLDR